MIKYIEKKDNNKTVHSEKNMASEEKRNLQQKTDIFKKKPFQILFRIDFYLSVTSCFGKSKEFVEEEEQK